MRYLSIFSLVILAVLLLVMPMGTAGANPYGVGAKADKLLREMSDYLAVIPHFTVHVEASQEVLSDQGQKLMFDRQANIAVQRPDRFVAQRKGEFRDQVMYYDGAQLTLHDRTVNFFATVTALPTIDETLNFATETLGLSAPGGDLIYSDVYGGLMQGVTSGQVVGQTVVAGVPCYHLAFRGAEVDWQIWIEVGEKPFPRKYVITSKWLAAAPQYAVRLTQWDTETALSDDQFRFQKPEGAVEIDFFNRQVMEEAPK